MNCHQFQNFQAFNNRSFSYNFLNRFDRALEDCKKSIALNKDYSLAYKNCGLAYLGQGKLEDAEKEFRTALEKSSISWRSHLGLAAVFRKRGDYDAAIKEFEIALQSPRDSHLAKQGIEEVRALIAARDAPPTVAPPVEKRDPQPTEPPKAPTSGPQPTTPQKTELPPAPPTAPLRRVALVVGNGAYASVPRLANPSRDAAAIADTLKSIGFSSVAIETDVTRQKMIEALRKFEKESDGADWGVIYFAGHGIEFGGENFLIPVEAKLETDRDAKDEAVPLERVMNAFPKMKSLGLVVLDACRNNPFRNGMRRTIATRSIENGLARVEPPRGGVLVAYAAKDGETALDGSGQNSPYVTALTARLKQPNLEIRKLLGLVRDDVLASTNDQQEPFIYGGLGGRDYVLNPQ